MGKASKFVAAIWFIGLGYGAVAWFEVDGPLAVLAFAANYCAYTLGVIALMVLAMMAFIVVLTVVAGIFENIKIWRERRAYRRRFR